MMKCGHKATAGFTLVELAIVLAVTGVLFGGLYRILSGGNQQMKDTSVANQHVQLINAVKSYLNSSAGQTWMSEGAPAGTQGIFGVAANFPLPLPAVAPDGVGNAACKAAIGDLNLKSFCDNLPAGFSAATINAYGQAYTIRVVTPALAGTAAAPTPPSTYSFIVLATGGDAITDSDGGRISDQIGADGGFVYSAAGSCSAASTITACGTYGAWQATLTGAAPSYGFAVPVAPAYAGSIASRTFVSPEFFTNLPWLSRKFLPGIDTAPVPATPTLASPNYETMTTPMYMGGKSIYMQGSITNTVPPTGGDETMKINMQGAQISDTYSNSTEINFDAGNNGGAGANPGVGGPGYLGDPAGTPGTPNPFITLESHCTQYSDNGAAGLDGIPYIPGAPSTPCLPALQVSGDVDVLAQLNATLLYAGTFVYNTSGAPSDIRLKKDIKPLHHALDDVLRLNPVSFRYKQDDTVSLGVVAQEIEKVYPELVFQYGGYKAVNMNGLIAPLVASVQELKHENDNLRVLIKEQQDREDKLEELMKAKGTSK